MLDILVSDGVLVLFCSVALMMRHCRLPVCMLATLFVFFILYEFLDLVWVRDSSEMVIKDKTAKLANQLQARMQRSNILEYELILAESSDIVTRSRVSPIQTLHT